PTAEIRCGILTMREKWALHFQTNNFSYFTRDYLSQKFPLVLEDDNILLNGSVCPFPEYIEEIKSLEKRQQLVYEDKVIAIRMPREELEQILRHTDEVPYYELLQKSDVHKVRSQYKPISIDNLWDIFTKNGEALTLDYNFLTKGKNSQPVSATNQVLGAHQIFLEEGAIVECSMINALGGPVYIGKGAEIMEGCMIRGPFALCEGSALKMGAKIYGPTTIGPHSKVGGEVNNSVIIGYSNKGHDGFLGNSVIGEWCNLGADTNNSNLKNNYGEVQIYSHFKNTYIKTGLQFCGLIMGDHSKSAINTMFNTGTVIGVNANVFGGGFPPKFIPSFSWGGDGSFSEYSLDKAMEVASKVYERRSMFFDLNEQALCAKIFEITANQRKVRG
ncbi:MAG: GlmU family protein, partial [Bacteroidetes bacterium]|nr:GlmU family protein [Bacteroidota bacterium]